MAIIFLLEVFILNLGNKWLVEFYDISNIVGYLMLSLLYIYLEKYEDRREQCSKNDWSTDIFPLEIGSRGFISNTTSTFLTKIGLTPAKKREYIKKRSKTRL